jgi:hypothetical protein
MQLEDAVMDCCVSGGITCVNDLSIKYMDGENLNRFVRRRTGENEVSTPWFSYALIGG